MADNTRTILIVLGIAILLVATYMIYDSMKAPQMQKQAPMGQSIKLQPSSGQPDSGTGNVQIKIGKSQEVR